MKKIAFWIFASIVITLNGTAQFLGCNAYFNYTLYGSQVHFQPMYSDSSGVTTYQWSFGDGSTSTEPWPMHDYATTGTYTVCLTVTNTQLECFQNFCLDIELCVLLSEVSYWQVDGNTWHFENTGYQGNDQMWLIYPYGLQFMGNSFDYSFYMSGTYQILHFMTTEETYTHYFVNSLGQVSSASYLCSSTETVNVNIDIETGSVVSGYVFMDNNQDGIMQPDELPGITVVELINGNQHFSMPVNDQGYYEIELAPGNYSLLCYWGLWNSLTATVPLSVIMDLGMMVPVYEFTVGDNQPLSGLNFGFFDSAITVSGKVFGDSNLDADADEGEPGYPYARIYANGVLASIAESSGNYQLVLPLADSYEITTDYSGSYTAPVGGVYFITDPLAAQAFPDLNFGLDVSVNDVACDFIWVSPHVPGFYSEVLVKAINYGQPQSDIGFSLSLDSDVEFVSCSDGGVYNSGTHSINWSLDLSTLQQLEFYIEVYVPVNIPMETSIVYSALIASSANDDFPANNVSFHQSFVVASFDPNMIEVNPAGQTEAGFVPPNLNMQYTIHFQNTGNYYATNVILKNELPAELNPASLHVVASSHACNTFIDGQELRFVFSNIMLPWEELDEAGSQGWVTYRIEQQPDLPEGTTIENTAAIYFDFNEPIITNTALNTIDYTFSVNEASAPLFVKVWPNPADEMVTLSWNTPLMNARYELSDVMGQMVHSGRMTGSVWNLHRGNLSAGTYYLRLYEGDNALRTIPVMFK